MRTLFIDTSYLIALINPRDRLHENAVAFSRNMGDSMFVTSQMVMTEFLNYFAEKGKFWRGEALQVVYELSKDLRTTIFPQSSALFEKALKFYENRTDKGYSLTDCSSMVIMNNEGIGAVLTADMHFVQEGYKALLS